MSLDITPEVMDTIGTPIIAFTSLALIASQVDEVLDFDSDILDGLSDWPGFLREGMLRDARREVRRIRDWSNRVLDVLAEVEAKLPPVEDDPDPAVPAPVDVEDVVP